MRHFVFSFVLLLALCAVVQADEAPIFKAAEKVCAESNEANWKDLIHLAEQVCQDMESRAGSVPCNGVVTIPDLLMKGVKSGPNQNLNSARNAGSTPPTGFINSSCVVADGGWINNTSHVTNSLVVVRGDAVLASHVTGSVVIATGKVTIAAHCTDSIIVSLGTGIKVGSHSTRSILCGNVMIGSFAKDTVVVGDIVSIGTKKENLVVKEGRDLDGWIQAIGSAADDAGEAAEDVGDAADDAGEAADDAAEAADDAADSLKDAQERIEDAKEQLKDAQKQLEDANKEMDEQGNAFRAEPPKPDRAERDCLVIDASGFSAGKGDLKSLLKQVDALVKDVEGACTARWDGLVELDGFGEVTITSDGALELEDCCYRGSAAPGPNMDDCVVVIDGDFKALTGYIKDSVVIVTGDFEYGGYLKSSVLIVQGEIRCAGYAKDSLVVSAGDQHWSYAKDAVLVGTVAAASYLKDTHVIGEIKAAVTLKNTTTSELKALNLDSIFK